MALTRLEFEGKGDGSIVCSSSQSSDITGSSKNKRVYSCVLETQRALKNILLDLNYSLNLAR